ncbi:P-type conjugative transfer protein VirB9 [Bosea sp. (in: a-proteobacteria)]|uniref:P-type conjugative transfer protein VirB9 n=1 Tax=Bosea sp. (in: a-proteobacteria) TaxID=1871050 RepID=UPI0011F90E6E|nr:P-type conjugative transfer protein VirB9 [Bosea sp. (in: a-proteobacteria)]TAJ31965.1 MAG: P-type conjugative transfer protein VirB9 [Bosea sp. (in: a-proteobacteria)]
MKSWCRLAALLSLAASPVLAEDTPRSGPADPRVKFVEYQETQVYRVVGTFRTATQIVLGDDETIEHVALGDTVSWEVAVAGHILFLKPRERAGPTNLIVTTNRAGDLRNYAFELTARRGPISSASANTFFQVRFRYPRDEAERAARLRAALEAQRVAALQATVVKGALDHGVIEGPRNLNYKVQGATSLQPSEISDNGQFTVLRFPGNHEIPAIYLVRPDGSETLVPFDVRDEFVVVHMVAAQLRLRRNREVLCIYNLAPTTYGVDPGTNTASPHVERTIQNPKE